MRISFEYLPGWLEPTEEEIIRLSLYVSETKKNVSIPEAVLKVEKAVLKNFAIFTGKHLRWSVLLIDLQASRPATLLKRDSNTCIFL